MIRGRAPDALEFMWRSPACEAVDPEIDDVSCPAAVYSGVRAAVDADVRTVDADARAAIDAEARAAIDADARAALVNAGYKAGEARAAVLRARPHVGGDASLDQVLREALRRCISPLILSRAGP